MKPSMVGLGAGRCRPAPPERLSHPEAAKRPNGTKPDGTGVVMAALAVGNRVTNLTFLHPDGTSVSLSQFPGALLLIFLRHLR